MGLMLASLAPILSENDLCLLFLLPRVVVALNPGLISFIPSGFGDGNQSSALRAGREGRRENYRWAIAKGKKQELRGGEVFSEDTENDTRVARDSYEWKTNQGGAAATALTADVVTVRFGMRDGVAPSRLETGAPFCAKTQRDCNFNSRSLARIFR